MRNLLFVLAGACLLVASAVGQYTSFNVSLAARISLGTFNASSGNSCWGYVSPSGREYALMGLNNKLAFVEITNPSQPVWFASISHLSNTWADVKVYQDVAYLVTERSGTGIQVIDMANIDNHQVTLVRTIEDVGRTHTITVDTTSGFLYTCGSRDSPGTTTCWNLANPRNPVRVGVNSITGTTYVHEGFAMTYPAGTPYAGKQVFFASSAFDGLMIWDVTNKNNPILMQTVLYPMLGYTHQAWISDDLKYMYLNDEFDETTFNIPSRTIVFDVESLENASYVTSYTNGNSAVDHNLYFKDGYIFSSNYTSGLRIWSTHNSATAPTEVGWFDTYPADDDPIYEGTWSNFPYFPSGTVIASDINRGLFIFNAAAALTREIPATLYTLVRGIPAGGNQASLNTNDGNRLTLRPGITLSPSQAPIEFVLESKADSTTPVRLDFLTDSRATSSSIQESVEFFNFVTNQYEVVKTRQLTTSDTSSYAIPTGNKNRFVAADKTVRVRLRYRPTAPVLVTPWNAAIDQAVWINMP